MKSKVPKEKSGGSELQKKAMTKKEMRKYGESTVQSTHVSDGSNKLTKTNYETRDLQAVRM